MMTTEFIKEILAGNKRLLKLSEVKYINIPKYDELSVKNLYPKLIALENMKHYFPDKYSKGR